MIKDMVHIDVGHGKSDLLKNTLKHALSLFSWFKIDMMII